MDENMEEGLTHVVVAGLILVVFLLAVYQMTDPEAFFHRLYAKDNGLIVEALHSANGEVELTYNSIHPEHAAWFDFTEAELYVGRPSPEEGSFQPSVRQQYGAVAEQSRPLVVVPQLLQAPGDISYTKSGALIRIGGTLSACAAARGILPREQTGLLLLGTALEEVRASPPVAELEATLAQALQSHGLRTDDFASLLEGRPVSPAIAERLLERGIDVWTINDRELQERLQLPEYLIILKLEQGAPQVIVGNGPIPEAFGCLLREELERSHPAIPLVQGTGSMVVVSLPEGDETRDILIALTEMVR